jgi:hypothetical protein
MAKKAKKKTVTRSSKKATTRRKAAPAAAAAAPREVLLVGSKVRQAIKDAGCNTGGDAIDGLNDWVHWLLAQATARATANNRKTVRKHDFMVVP